MIFALVQAAGYSSPQEVTFTSFVQLVEDGEIDSIQIDGYTYTGENEETRARYRAPGPRSGDPLHSMPEEAIAARQREGDPVTVSWG